MSEWTRDKLIAFEKDIAECYERAEIPYPVHLDGGNEDGLIGYFDTNFTPGDWVCGTWRMHYKCLLAGVPPAILKHHIMSGRSITLCFPRYNIFSSALVGHTCSVAMGIAYEIERNKSPQKVHCFIGDMAARTGMAYETMDYAVGHALPITWIVEDNGKSVTTNTQEVWGNITWKPGWTTHVLPYTPTWPHQGIGKRVEF
jgi:TPP-dependent pyruvate/acetoin dehydrogenase alpha subunit